MNPKQIGEITEQCIIAELMKIEIPISKPIGDNQPYDLLMDYNNEIYRCQCKTGKLKDGFISFSVISHRINTKHNYKTYYIGKIHFFLVYCQENQSFYFLPIEQCKTAKSEVRLRITKPKNNQTKYVQYAINYTLDKIKSYIDNRLDNGGVTCYPVQSRQVPDESYTLDYRNGGDNINVGSNPTLPI